MATKKDKVAAQQTTPSVYGGQYDQQINDLYGQMQNREPFKYDLNALYQQYKNMYTKNAQQSMKDTMGQAASLTGGYGNTYAQNVGQQAYDRQMDKLNAIAPELEERAYNRWQQQGQDILNQFNLANQLGSAAQATEQQNKEWDFEQQKYADTRSDAEKQWDLTQQQWDLTQKQYEDSLSQYADKQVQQAYTNLSTAILTSGYEPTKDELTAAGMTDQQAAALRQAWIASYPGLAYMQGVITAEEYLKLTGQQAPDAVVAAAGGGGGGGRGGKKSTYDKDTAAEQQYLQSLGFNVDVTGNKNDSNYQAAKAQHQDNVNRQVNSLKAAGYSDASISQILGSSNEVGTKKTTSTNRTGSLTVKKNR